MSTLTKADKQAIFEILDGAGMLGDEQNSLFPFRKWVSRFRDDTEFTNDMLIPDDIETRCLDWLEENFIDGNGYYIHLGFKKVYRHEGYGLTGDSAIGSWKTFSGSIPRPVAVVQATAFVFEQVNKPEVK